MLGLAAIAIAASVVHREFFSPSAAPAAPIGLNPLSPPQHIKNWQEVLSVSTPLSDTTAPIRIVEFGDFECPFCSRYEATLQRVQKQYGKVVSRSFVQWPLEIHRYAMPAARAAECARDEGKFAEMHDALFAKQGSLGSMAWTSYALDAGIADTARFSRCMSSATPFPKITRGVELATRMALSGTPTVIINGWQFVGGPPDTAIAKAIDDLLHDKRPRGAKGN